MTSSPAPTWQENVFGRPPAFRKITTARLTMVCCLVLPCLPLAVARADTRCRFSGAADLTLPLVAHTFSAGAKVPVGARLTPFVTLNRPDFWTCARQEPFGEMFVTLQSHLPTARTTYIEDSMHHAVFGTNLPGVGIVFRYAVWDGERWVTVTPAPEAALTSNAVEVGPLRGSTPFGDTHLGLKLSAAFIKTEADTLGTVDFSQSFFRVSITAHGDESEFEPATELQATTGPRFVESTCDMQEVDVDLPRISASSLGGPGRSAGAVDFQLNLSNCPDGRTTLFYQIDAAPGFELDAASGVLGLGADASATGLGVQVRSATDATLPLGHRHFIDAYRRDTGGHVTIPLRAAYFQVGERVRPGSVRSVAVVTLWYQ